jgi:antitoxin ParD1/3/4
MPTMNVSLTSEFLEFVEQEVARGDYASASEVVRDSLRLLRREKAADAEKLAILRREIQIGVDEADRGAFSERSVSDIARDVIERHKPRN